MSQGDTRPRQGDEIGQRNGVEAIEVISAKMVELAGEEPPAWIAFEARKAAAT